MILIHWFFFCNMARNRTGYNQDGRGLDIEYIWRSRAERLLCLRRAKRMLSVVVIYIHLYKRSACRIIEFSSEVVYIRA